MDCNKPCCHEVDEVMQHVCICHSVNCGINGDAEKEYAREVPETRCDARYHFPTSQGLDQEDERHDGKYIMVGRKRCKPVNGQVVNPDYEDREVDRENPEHENQD